MTSYSSFKWLFLKHLDQWLAFVSDEQRELAERGGQGAGRKEAGRQGLGLRAVSALCVFQ